MPRQRLHRTRYIVYSRAHLRFNGLEPVVSTPLSRGLSYVRDRFHFTCLSSGNSVVQFISQNGVHFRRMLSRLAGMQSFVVLFTVYLCVTSALLLNSLHGRFIIGI